MNIFYNDVDITADVHPLVLKLVDNAGGKPDSITSVFSDSEGEWSQWKPSKNDKLQIKKDGYDTGIMFIDHIGQYAGKFEIKVLSIPQESKTARTQAWEDVRLLEIATEIAARYGFKLNTFNITNHFYKRVDQLEEADFSFLSNLCTREGYALKINDRSIVIYDESTVEQNNPDESKTTFYPHDMIGGYEFVNKSVDIYGKCIIRCQTLDGYIEAEHKDSNVNGPTLFPKIYAQDLAEAQRWSKGILRSYNKHMISGRFTTELKTGFAAGSNLFVKDVGMFDGKYFVHRIEHDLVNNRTVFTVRRPLEGY